MIYFKLWVTWPVVEEGVASYNSAGWCFVFGTYYGAIYGRAVGNSCLPWSALTCPAAFPLALRESQSELSVEQYCSAPGLARHACSSPLPSLHHRNSFIMERRVNKTVPTASQSIIMSVSMEISSSLSAETLCRPRTFTSISDLLEMISSGDWSIDPPV